MRWTRNGWPSKTFSDAYADTGRWLHSQIANSFLWRIYFHCFFLFAFFEPSHVFLALYHRVVSWGLDESDPFEILEVHNVRNLHCILNLAIKLYFKFQG